MEDLLLIIDHREKAIFPHLELEGHQIKYTKQTLETGDYALFNTKTKKYVAIFERKELSDYGASIKDGRHQNKEKLIKFREQNNCAIIYIVEGPSHPGPGQFFSNIEYWKIESSIFHLMIRDNIQIMETLNKQHTVTKLIRFMKSMATLIEADAVWEKKQNALKSAQTATSEQAVTSGSEVKPVEADKPETKVETDKPKPTTFGEQKDISSDVHAEINKLKVRVEKQPIDVHREIWACFPGISTVSADIFVAKYSILDVISGKLKEVLPTMKTASGMKLSKKIITSLNSVNVPMEEKLLSRVPSISAKTAKLLLTGKRLMELITADKETLAALVVGQKKLGNIKASRIIQFLATPYVIENK